MRWLQKLYQSWAASYIRWPLLAGFLLRLIPMVIWAEKTCVRDECTYEKMVFALYNGDGITGTMGWLWAPAYPILMAIMKALTGYMRTVQVLQLGASLVSTVLVASLAERVWKDRRPALLAAWLFALNPTFIFYTSNTWSETIYTTLLLLLVARVGEIRAQPSNKAALKIGFLVGLSVLFRGVATYLLPLVLAGIGWGRGKAGLKAAVACMLAAVLTVAPYSLYASQKFDGLVISDRTLGQMMWLGNNTFLPMTFDYGNGTLRQEDYDRKATEEGRHHCPFEQNPVVQDSCELENGKQWIRENPKEFLRRIPYRVAQLVNPNSFLTRHLRWGRWAGLPDFVDEILIVLVVLSSFLNLVGGTIGWFVRMQQEDRWYPLLSGSIVLYHVSAIAVLAGLTRYRVPLEPLWLILAAGLPFVVWRMKIGWKLACIATTGLLIVLMLYFLPCGWRWLGLCSPD